LENNEGIHFERWYQYADKKSFWERLQPNIFRRQLNRNNIFNDLDERILGDSDFVKEVLAWFGYCGTIPLIAPYKTPFCGAIKYLRQIKWRISAYRVQSIEIQIPNEDRIVKTAF
jgi:hypothetical protein